MREFGRGALLSVLFFVLLWGSAPTMAAADLYSVSSAHASPGACNSNGGTWVDSDSAGNPNGYCNYGAPPQNPGCSMLEDLTDAAAWMAAAGGGLALIPEPATTAVGGMIVAAFLPLGFAGFLMQQGMGC